MKNRIGIVGGGQLARMLIFSAKKMGFFVTVLDPTPNSPGGQIADKQIVADLSDEKAMWQLAKDADYITLDWELANPDLLEKLEKKGIPVNPSPKTLRMIKDKYLQKVFLQKAGIPVAPFVDIPSRHSGKQSASRRSYAQGRIKNGSWTSQDDDIRIAIENAADKFGYPLLLKAKVGAYDGRGNYVIKNKQDIKNAVEKLKGQELYIEKFVPFEKELAVMVARSIKGEIKTFPVVQTIHKNNILHIVLTPAPIEKKIAKNAENLARKVMQHLKGAGVFGIEMFLTKNGEILVNEIAPRVHNSGHVTIESCITSQFEQHIRAITGLPLGKTDLIMPFAVMINILGQKTGRADVQGLENALKIPGVSVHIYGKADTKIERKMGHITALDKTLDKALNKALRARGYIGI